MMNFKELNLFLKYNNIENRAPHYYLKQEMEVILKNEKTIKKEVYFLIKNAEIKKENEDICI